MFILVQFGAELFDVLLHCIESVDGLLAPSPPSFCNAPVHGLFLKTNGHLVLCFRRPVTYIGVHEVTSRPRRRTYPANKAGKHDGDAVQDGRLTGSIYTYQNIYLFRELQFQVRNTSETNELYRLQPHENSPGLITKQGVSSNTGSTSTSGIGGTERAWCSDGMCRNPLAMWRYSGQRSVVFSSRCHPVDGNARSGTIVYWQSGRSASVLFNPFGGCRYESVVTSHSDQGL